MPQLEQIDYGSDTLEPLDPNSLREYYDCYKEECKFMRRLPELMEKAAAEFVGKTVPLAQAFAAINQKSTGYRVSVTAGEILVTTPKGDRTWVALRHRAPS